MLVSPSCGIYDRTEQDGQWYFSVIWCRHSPMLSEHQEFQHVQLQCFPKSVTSLAIWWQYFFKRNGFKKNPSKIFSWEKKKFTSLIRHVISSKKLWLSQNYNKQPIAEPKELCARQELQNVVCSLPSHYLHLPPPLKAVGCSSITHLTQLCLLLL